MLFVRASDLYGITHGHVSMRHNELLDALLIPLPGYIGLFRRRTMNELGTGSQNAFCSYSMVAFAGAAISSYAVFLILIMT